MTRLTQNSNGVRDMAFVRANGLQRCWFANDCAVRAERSRFRKVTCAGHAGLFIGGGQNVEWLFQFRDIHTAQCIENKGEKAFHIRGAQTVELIVVLGEGEGIARPTPIVKRYGIGMACQQQTAGTVPDTRQHVEFIARTRNRLNLNIET